MIIVYNFFIALFRISLWVASPFNQKAKLFRQGRKNIFKKLAEALRDNKSPLVWLHCASLGEFEQGRPVIEALKKDFSDHKILVTFFSPSGFEVRKNFELADYVFYLPWDTQSNAKRLVNIVRPKIAVFVKYEFWYHFAHQLSLQKVPLISISSKFRKDQVFFQGYGSIFRAILKKFTHFFVQNSESVRLLQSIGITNASVSGDTRFDRVKRIVSQNQSLPVAEKFKNNQKVIVVGSCWSEDLEVLIPFINENRVKIIIAPHEISLSTLAELEKSLQVKAIRYSEAQKTNPEDYSVLIIDNIGLLSSLYRYGEFAYVGGAFGKGLHNILEAACYGVPVLFGNRNYEKFQEAVDLINRGGAFAIQDYPDLKSKYEILNSPESFLLACEVTRQYVDENLGATQKIMNYVAPLLKRHTALVK